MYQEPEAMDPFFLNSVPSSETVSNLSFTIKLNAKLRASSSVSPKSTLFVTYCMAFFTDGLSPYSITSITNLAWREVKRSHRAFRNSDT